jgi:hypothetical protein
VVVGRPQLGLPELRCRSPCVRVMDMAIALVRVELNPFDLKTALLTRHAQHVALIHFPIGLSVTAVAFDIHRAREEAAEFGGRGLRARKVEIAAASSL